MRAHTTPATPCLVAGSLSTRIYMSMSQVTLPRMELFLLPAVLNFLVLLALALHIRPLKTFTSAQTRNRRVLRRGSQPEERLKQTPVNKGGTSCFLHELGSSRLFCPPLEQAS